MNKTVTCVICPRGCTIEVVQESENSLPVSVKGYGCKRGEQYATLEVYAPERVFTSTVKMSDGKLLPVRSSKPIPKKLIIPTAKMLSEMTFDGKYFMGDVVVNNVLDSGVDIVASCNS